MDARQMCDGVDRRRFLALGGAVAAAAAMAPRVALAATAGDSRLVLIQLRGGMDGLAAVPPIGDPHYASARGDLALPADRLLALDGLFALHPSLASLHALYRAGEAVVCHAMSTPYRDRSHFDGQDVLENGLADPAAARDGWLARSLAELPGGARDGETAVALARSMPLVLRGSPAATSWAPSVVPQADDDLIDRVAMMYEADPLLSTALDKARMAAEMAGEAANQMAGKRARKIGRNRVGAHVIKLLTQATAGFLAQETGPRIAVLDLGGWDTHSGQGQLSGRLSNQLTMLDTALAGLREGLAPVWDRTAILVATEFGRTVAMNGSGGTDHGIASAAFLAGGAVAGGRVVADWPGLARAALWQGRDLAPTGDLRALFKAVLADHMGVAPRALADRVFPDSGRAAPVTDLIKA